MTLIKSLPYNKKEEMHLSKTDAYTILYYLTFSFSLLCLFNSHSAFVGFRIISPLSGFIAMPLSLLLFILCFSRYKANQIIFLISISVLVVGTLFTQKGYFVNLLWFSYVLIISAKDLNFRNILKFHFILELCLLLICFWAYFNDYIDHSLIYEGEREDFSGDTVHRFDCGYLAATDFGTHVFYILLDYWILRKGILKWFEQFFYLFISYFLITYSVSRQPAGLVFLIVISSWYVSYKSRNKKSISKVAGQILIFSIPFFAIVSIYVSSLYDENDLFWITLDFFFSRRLQFGYNGIHDFGIPWFGQDIKMYAYSAGGSAYYNYIDCSYLQFIIRWGIVLFTISILYCVKIARGAYLRGDIVLLLALFLVGISSMITQYLYFFNYNILYVALTSSHTIIEIGNIKK